MTISYAARHSMAKITLIAIGAALLASCGEPKISESCTMNGYGRGSCSFTNTGSSEGAMCGNIFVTREFDNKYSISEIFCSGSVPPNSTNNIEFGVPDVNQICSLGTRPWSSVCSFRFSSTSHSSASWWGYLKIVILLIITAGLFKFGLPKMKQMVSRTYRKCPFCAEHIKNEAITCKHCGKDLPSLAEEHVQETVDTIPVSTNISLVKLVAVQPWWKRQSLGKEIIFASLLIELASLPMENDIMSYVASYLINDNSYIFGHWVVFSHISLSLQISLLSILICWLYPLISIVRNSAIKIKISIVGPTVFFLWIMYCIYDLKLRTDTGMPDNLWVELLALITLVIGLALYKPIRKD